MKKSVCVCGILMLAIPLSAQERTMGKSLFSVQAGPSRYLGKMIGITDYSDAYRNELREGVAWNASYYFLGNNTIARSLKLASGVVYQGGQYRNTHDAGSDKILMHYMAPQIALFLVKQKYNLSLSTGFGYQLYKDNSFVYDKPRKVSMNKWAYNLSAGGEYRLFSHVGLAVRLNWIVTASEQYSVRYHGQKWHVESPELSGGGGCFSQLALLLGMNYHF